MLDFGLKCAISGGLCLAIVVGTCRRRQFISSISYLTGNVQMNLQYYHLFPMFPVVRSHRLYQFRIIHENTIWWFDIPMENHHFLRENPLEMVMFNSYLSHYQRVHVERSRALHPSTPKHFFVAASSRNGDTHEVCRPQYLKSDKPYWNKQI